MNAIDQFVRRDGWILLSLGFLALLHGMVYIYIMPPWQHYDEPNHFEFVWLVAERGEIPQRNDYDPRMRREVALSMIEHDFYEGMDYYPNLDEPDGRIWIGTISQLGNQPLYYLLASLPLRLLPLDSVEGQLYAARWVSWIFFLLTILAAWGVVFELTPDGHPLRLLAPLALVLTPGFVDVMTAVNNDSAAVAFLALVLWGSIRMVQRGFSWGIFLAVVAVSILGYFTKELAYFAFPVLLLALLFSIFRGKYRWIVWTFLGIGFLSFAFLSMTWGDAAYWYRSIPQSASTRTTKEPVLGEYAFRLESKAGTSPNWMRPLFQSIGPGDPGTTYTLGAWIWADKPVTILTPRLTDGIGFYYSQIDIDREPRFFAASVTSSDSAPNRLALSLWIADQQSDATIYYDGLVLAEGERPLDVPPAFDDIHGLRGIWGGEPFDNLLRNASAETGGPRFRPEIDRLISRFTPDNTLPSALLTFFYDWEGSGWFFRSSAIRIFRTFWGKFGWGHVPLLGDRPYRVLGIFTLLGLLGLIGWVVRRVWASKDHLIKRFPDIFPWSAAFLLGFLLISGWVMALSRGAIYLSHVRLYMPVARYTYTAIIPTILLLSIGFHQVLLWVSGLIPSSNIIRNYLSIALFFFLFAGLDIYAIISILNFYSWR